jgi:hypothetical protein
LTKESGYVKFAFGLHVFCNRSVQVPKTAISLPVTGESE